MKLAHAATIALILIGSTTSVAQEVHVAVNGLQFPIVSASTHKYPFGTVMYLGSSAARHSVFSKAPEVPAASSCQGCDIQAAVLVGGQTFFVSVTKDAHGNRVIVFQNEKGDDLTTPLAAKMAGHPSDEIKIFSFLCTVMPDFNANSQDLKISVIHFGHGLLADCGDSCWAGYQCPANSCYVCQSLKCK